MLFLNFQSKCKLDTKFEECELLLGVDKVSLDFLFFISSRLVQKTFVKWLEIHTQFFLSLGVSTVETNQDQRQDKV